MEFALNSEGCSFISNYLSNPPVNAIKWFQWQEWTSERSESDTELVLLLINNSLHKNYHYLIRIYQ